jgi:hypothetical protein
MALPKSLPEQKADAIKRAMRRGRATTKDASVILGIHYKTVLDRIGRGKLMAFTIGGHQYVSLEELVNQGAALPHFQDRFAE